jgi:hypothetical protein
MANTSVYFDGSSYLSCANTSTNLIPGTSQFTLEAWVNPTDYVLYNQIVTKGSASATTGSWLLGIIITTGELYWQHSGDTSIRAQVIPLTSWSHVAVTRDSSNNLRLYVNGVLGSTTTTYTTNLSETSDLRIGRGRTTSTNYFNGYISNVRFIKGVALYTGSTFTVPTFPLTATAETQLLAAQNINPLVDNSTNGFTLVSSGSSTTTVYAYNPATGNVLNPGVASTYTPYVSPFDSVSLIDAVNLPAVFSPTTSKTLKISFDPFVDTTIINPEQAYSTDN